MRRDNSRVYAEISVSPMMYQQMLHQPALELKNFDEPLMSYPTLSPSANIVKLSLTRLPAQYGRKDGGTTQLKADIHHSLDKYGQLIDCGYVIGGSSIYASGDYAVLAVNSTYTKFEHSLNWTYQPIDFSSGDLLPERNNILSLATWAAMPPYCKYCHSMDHALIDCETHKKKLTYDFWGIAGHFQRSCPRRNEDPDNSTKKRKGSKAQQKQVTSDSSTANSKSTAAVKKVATAQFAAAAKTKAAAEDRVAADAEATAAKVAANAHYAANAYTEANARTDANNAQDAANTLNEFSSCATFAFIP
ncbi:uncharacterized protein ATC70_004013 [Mucor velutinosus]|uniref:Uncharacterized protein n=1 Tax=Mucor velutinosus TaxID=708070 RepID=A0AAN7DT59_9FUNG|nr:hypothetical protein ATC70_004013 [Mucor velutinosus]